MIFRFKDGRPSPNPTSLEHAIEIKHNVYNDEVVCTTCNIGKLKYTKTHKCIRCALREAITFYNFHKRTRLVWSDEHGNHFSQPEYNSTPAKISDSEWLEMTRLSEIGNSDHAFAVRTEPCKLLGHVGLTRLGQCFLCTEEKRTPSPRQTALTNGDKWYMPTVQCPKCGQTTLKRVSDGLCKGCAPSGPDGRETADSTMMREEPDMIIDKVTADECGMIVFRTGQPCHKGHAGWRYVKRGNCIPCLRGDK